jgi:hypothetical protein
MRKKIEKTLQILNILRLYGGRGTGLTLRPHSQLGPSVKGSIRSLHTK